MYKMTYFKKRAALLAKQSAAVVALPLVFIVGASAAGPNVAGVVTDIGDLMDPIALVGGAYIGLKVFQRGWTIIRGFI